MQDLDDDEQRVLIALEEITRSDDGTHGPARIEDLASKLALPISDVDAVLSRLRDKGLVDNMDPRLS